MKTVTLGADDTLSLGDISGPVRRAARGPPRAGLPRRHLCNGQQTLIMARYIAATLTHPRLLEIMPTRPAPKSDARYPLPLRLSGLWQALRGQRPRKRQRLAFVTLNQRRYKRVSFGDSAQAEAVEKSFERYGPDARFPELVLRQENEIWVKFVDGAPVRRELASADGLAEFFAGLYARESRPQALDELPLLRHLRRDLEFLADVGLLSAGRVTELATLAERHAPSQVHIGFDYLDAVLKNFVWRADGSLCAIDIESLRHDCVQGLGFAKARQHWKEPLWQAVSDRLRERGAIPFADHVDLLELCFLARWTKTKIVTGKWRFVDAARFDAVQRRLAVA